MHQKESTGAQPSTAEAIRVEEHRPYEDTIDRSNSEVVPVGQIELVQTVPIGKVQRCATTEFPQVTKEHNYKRK